MKRHLIIPYTSAWFTVALPTAEFLLIWIGLPVLLFSLLGWNFPDWVAFLSCGVSMVIALAVCVLTYPLLMRLAERGRGELILEGDRLRWRTARRWQEVDFSGPHKAKIAAGAGGLGGRNASVTLYPGGEMVHLAGISRGEVLRLFPEPYFVKELAVRPEEGLWGFDLPADDPAAWAFFEALLESVWRNRQNNSCFQLYARYPWSHRPQPAFRHIRLIRTDEMTPEDEVFIADLLERFVDGLTESYVRVTPDYLVGWVYRSLKSNWTGTPDYYCVMPLGHVTAEVSLPRPDWKPFVISQVILEAASSLTGVSRIYGPTLQDRRYLYVRGRGEDGAPLELAFDWYNLTDKEWEEAEMVVRFVGRVS